MFIGEYKYKVDEKKRLSIPSKFRKFLKPGAVITRGIDVCLFLYPKKEWQKLALKLSQLSITNQKTRAFVRLILSGAMDVKLDKLGRIIIPDYLKEYGGIGKEAVIIGLYNRLEIWDGKRWLKYRKNNELESEKIAEELSNLGI